MEEQEIPKKITKSNCAKKFDEIKSFLAKNSTMGGRTSMKKNGNNFREISTMTFMTCQKMFKNALRRIKNFETATFCNQII